MLTLVSGGARSGKSRFALSLCPELRAGFLATARIGDEEMKRRVDRHRAERPPGWTTVEEPIRIADAARRLGTSAGVVLVECLTLWTSNLLLDMAHASPETVEAFALNEIDAIAALARTTRIVLVTNEVGSGIVPDSALCRRFQDLHGWINQRAAAHADEVFLIVSGLPLPVKPAGPR